MGKRQYNKQIGNITISLCGDYGYVINEILRNLLRMNGNYTFTYSNPIEITCSTFGKNKLCKGYHEIFNAGKNPIIKIGYNKQGQKGDYYYG